MRKITFDSVMDFLVNRVLASLMVAIVLAMAVTILVFMGYSLMQVVRHA